MARTHRPSCHIDAELRPRLHPEGTSTQPPDPSRVDTSPTTGLESCVYALRRRARPSPVQRQRGAVGGRTPAHLLGENA